MGHCTSSRVSRSVSSQHLWSLVGPDRETSGAPDSAVTEGPRSLTVGTPSDLKNVTPNFTELRVDTCSHP